MLNTHTASDTTGQGRSLLPMALFFVSIFAMAGVAMEALRGTTHPVLSSFLGTAPSLVFLTGLAILGGLWYLHGESAGTFRRILALFVVGIPLAGVLGTIQGLEAAPPYWGGFAGRQLSVMLLHVLGLPTVAAAGLALLLAVATSTLAWRLAFAPGARPASAAEVLARMNAAPTAQQGHFGESAGLDDAVISADSAASGVGLLDVEEAEAIVIDEEEGVEVEATLPVAEEDELEDEEALAEEEEPRSVLHGIAASLDPDVELMDPITDLSEELGGEEEEFDAVEERYAEIAAADAAEGSAAAIAVEVEEEVAEEVADEIEDAAPLVEADEDEFVLAGDPSTALAEIEDERASTVEEEGEGEPVMLAHIAAMFSGDAESEDEEITSAAATAVEIAEPEVETARSPIGGEDVEAAGGDLEVLDGEYEDEDEEAEDEEEQPEEESGELWEDEDDEEGEDWEDEDDEEQGEWEEWEEDEGAEEPETTAEELTAPAADLREPAAGTELAATILEPVESAAAAEGWVESEEMAVEEVPAAAPTVGPFGSAEEDWAAWMEERRPARGISRPRPRQEEDAGQPTLFANPEDLDQDLFDRAVRLVIDEDRCSVAMLQRSLSVSFSEASALIERMQSEGVVGPQLASGRREILAPGREQAQTTDI